MIDVNSKVEELAKRVSAYKREVMASYVGAKALIKFLDFNKTESTMIVGENYIRSMIAIGRAYEEACGDYIEYLKEQHLQYKKLVPSELVSEIQRIEDEVKQIKENIDAAIREIRNEMGDTKEQK